MYRVGKQVGDDLYVHVSTVDSIVDSHRDRVRAAIAALPDGASQRIGVAKINIRTACVSLLEYSAFDDDPFPALVSSWTMRNGGGSSLVLRSYADSLNPPAHASARHAVSHGVFGGLLGG